MTLADDIKASWLGLKPHPFPTAGGKQVIPVYLVREDKLNGLILEMQQETDSRDALIRELVAALKYAIDGTMDYYTPAFDTVNAALNRAKEAGYDL